MAPTRLLATVLTIAGLIVGVAPSAAWADNAIEPPPRHRNLEVHLQPYATLPDASTGSAPRLNAMATTGGRLFVVEELDARIYELVPTDDGARAELFFDVEAAVLRSTGRGIDHTNTFHGGLRSVAFHPDFASNGLFYTSAMEQRPADPGSSTYLSDVDEPIVADSVLVEWQVDPATGRPIATSYREVFRVGMPVYDHPIKQILFNPFSVPGDADHGLLYVAHGDGSVTSAIAGGGQRNDALGKILRIDPRSSGARSYTVPADNPFIGDPTMLDEVYSLGHRNPHHLSFGRHNGDTLLIAAEAGRDNAEEINLVEAGGDYGWPQREGTFVHLPNGGIVTGVTPLPVDDARFGFTYPAAQYGHEGPLGSSFVRQAVAGGFPVSNGSPLSGQYLFSDFAVSGTLYHSAIARLTSAQTTGDPARLTQAPIGVVEVLFDHDRNPATPALPRADLADVFDDSPNYETTRADVRFGQGPGGELYITSKRNNTVYLVTSSLPGGPGGFGGSRSTFVCSVTAVGGGFEVTWENAPSDTARMIVERQASSRFWWRGRTSPEAKTFTDPGVLPPRTSRIDYRAVAKRDDGSVIDSADCQLRNSAGATCTAVRDGGRDLVRWNGRSSGDVVIRRQVSEDAPFYWRARLDAAVSQYRDRVTSGEVRYQVIGRDPQGRIIDGAACSIPS